MKRLGKSAREYLESLRRLEIDKAPFGHRELARQLGDKTHNRTWGLMQRLIEAGYVVPGKRLALIDCPIVTPMGRRALKKAA